jgi:hypothetical protein
LMNLPCVSRHGAAEAMLEPSAATKINARADEIKRFIGASGVEWFRRPFSVVALVPATLAV